MNKIIHRLISTIAALALTIGSFVDTRALSQSPVQIISGNFTSTIVLDGHKYYGTIIDVAVVQNTGVDGMDAGVVAHMGEHEVPGGPDNCGNRRWHVGAADNSVRFTIHSPDGAQGYPGALAVAATYRLAGMTLSLDLEAVTTRPTVVNLTNHAYWNLSAGERDAFAHEMTIDADSYLPLNELLLPSGEIRSVAGLPQDFRARKKVAGFFDNCWVLNGRRCEMKHGLTLRDPVSGRQMEVSTTEAGMQMYTAWHWNEAMPGRNGPLQQSAAIAIEPQNFPDAPSHPNFPTAVLRPGETYRNRIAWRFAG